MKPWAQSVAVVLALLLSGPLAGAVVVATGLFLAWLAGAQVVPLGLLVPLAWLGAGVGWLAAWRGLLWVLKSAGLSSHGGR